MTISNCTRIIASNETPETAAKRGDLFLVEFGRPGMNMRHKFCMVTKVDRNGWAKELQTPSTANSMETVSRKASEIFRGPIIPHSRFPAGMSAEQILRALPHEYPQHEWLKEYPGAQRSEAAGLALLEQNQRATSA